MEKNQIGVFFNTNKYWRGSNPNFIFFISTISSCKKMPIILKPEIYEKSQWIFAGNKKEHFSSPKKISKKLLKTFKKHC